MSSIKIVAIVLLAAGILAVAYGSFSYTKDTHGFKVGSFEMSVKEKQRVNIPLWAGVAVMVAGAALLVVPLKR